MMPYNPFDKPIGEPMAVDDLQSLISKEVREGYYVEYKSAKPDNKKIGHSITSFGSTFGGRYLIGVEADKTQNVATRVCGFSTADWPDPIATVRDVTKSHISPVPLLFPQVVRLGDTGDRLALVVYVPGEQETPFVTLDGRIYARLQDASDPVPQKNRYELDQLISRGRQSQKLFEHFCQDTRGFSKDDSEQGWLHVYAMPYPSGLIDKPEFVSEEGLANAIKLSTTPHMSRAGDDDLFSGTVPLTAGQLSAGSVTLRQVAPARVGHAGLTVQLFARGSAKFHIPLERIPNPLYRHLEGRRDPIDEIEIPAVRSTIRHLRGEADADELSSLDRVHFYQLGRLWLTLTNLLTFYEAWLGDEGKCIELKVALALKGIWRTCPFVDTEHWALRVGKYGLPVMHEDDLRDRWEPGDHFLLPLSKGRQLWLELVPHVTSLVGLPETQFPHGLGDILERENRRQSEQTQGREECSAYRP
jgi:Schlafen, AlbA_2